MLWPDSEPHTGPVQLSRYLAAVEATTESAGSCGHISKGFCYGAQLQPPVSGHINFPSANFSSIS